MKLARDCALHPDDENALAAEAKKGCGFLLTTLIVALVLAVVWPRPAITSTLIPEAIAVAMVLVAAQVSSGRQAQARVRLAAKRAKKRQHEAVVALLLPLLDGFLWLRNARFDRTGEGHYHLAVAARALDEIELASYATEFLRRFRKGPWREKLDGP